MTQNYDNWIIKEDSFSASTAKAYEGLFTLGSSIVHIRGSLEEHLHDAPQNLEYMRTPGNVTAEEFPATKVKWGTYIPYVFGPHPTLKVEMLNLPYFSDIVPFAGDEKLDMERSSIEGYCRQLDMRTATLSRSLLWKTENGQDVSVEFVRFVSGVRQQLCLQKLTLSSESQVQITIRTGIDADVRTSGYDHFETVEIASHGDDGMRCSVNTNNDDTVSVLSKIIMPDIKWRFVEEDRKGYLLATITIPAGQQVVIEKRTAIATSLDREVQDTESILEDSRQFTFEQLHQEHCECWAKRWGRSDVMIEGDDESQLAIRVSVYHLLRCHVTDDPRVSIDAKGYAGDAYFGCYFWDSEIYMMPYFLYTEPDSARTLVDFRVRNLEAAKQNAISQGYRGAKYPWFTDTSGLERCPLWQYADHQVHVTADIVYAIAHYATAADESYLKGPAAEVIVETARYWMDRIDHRPGDDHVSILGVMGPDEYMPLSANNAFTNALVSFALKLAAKAGPHGGATDEECKSFKDTAKLLPVLRGRDGEVILQCEEFENLAEPGFDRFWKDRSKPFASQVSQERLYRSKTLKQPDVLMLMFLFPQDFTHKEMLKAWEYYLPYTTHDSSLSAGIHSIIATWLGLDNQSWQFWQKSLSKDLDVSKRGSQEGIHIACCACNWMIAVLGFAGMKTAMQTKVLTFEPSLPEKWQKLSFPVVWRGQSAFVELSHHQLVIHNKSDRPLIAKVSGNRQSIPADKSTAFAIQRNKAIKI